MPTLPRREFLRTSLTGSALLLTSSLRAQPEHPVRSVRKTEPGCARNVIFLVSDGMSLGTLTMAERHKRRQEGRGTHWLGLYERPDVRRALMDTASANSPVTDSAAASSAWGCGCKMNNGSINIDPEGRPRTPVIQLARSAGLGTGLVTTATITHATPAGFAAQVTARGEEGDIALQYLSVGVDVLLGGGSKFFNGKQRADHRDLLGDFSRAGYHLARDLNSLHAAPAAKARLLGVFSEGHLPYTLDHRTDPTLTKSVPTLAEMTRVALARLAEKPRGFILQVEGARIDHAAHANDIGGLIYDQLAFDEAVGVALAFAAGRNDTLVIITSDHGNANPGLNGTGGSFDSRGGSYGDTQACFDRVARFQQTNVWTLAGLGPKSTAEQVQNRVKEATDITFTDEEIDLLRRALRAEHREGYRVRNVPLVALGQILSNYTAVGWTGVAHTTDYTELAAIGPGSESIHGLVQNTALFGVMTHALGLVAEKS